MLCSLHYLVLSHVIQSCELSTQINVVASRPVHVRTWRVPKRDRSLAFKGRNAFCAAFRPLNHYITTQIEKPISSASVTLPHGKDTNHTTKQAAPKLPQTPLSQRTYPFTHSTVTTSPSTSTTYTSRSRTTRARSCTHSAVQSPERPRFTHKHHAV